jgi:hypothetical protein
MGAQGDQGAQGIQGEQGPMGPRGYDGPQSLTGLSASFAEGLNTSGSVPNIEDLICYDSENNILAIRVTSSSGAVKFIKFRVTPIE